MAADAPYASRPVYSTHGCVATSQPLASEIGLSILKQGGNAADAAVAVAAALNVTEPCSTGIGGDCFCLYYDAKEKTVRALNGSGRSPAALTMARVRGDGIEGPGLPSFHAHTVTVPGAAAGWADTAERFGSMPLADLLQPAIALAERGFAVQKVAAHSWQAGSPRLQAATNRHGGEMLMPSGKAPAAGDVMRMPALARTFRELAKHGKQGFYAGRVAEAVVAVVAEHGGCLTMEDLASHTTTFEDPIHVTYKGVDVWECPPNGQGITALLALNILDGIDVAAMGHNTAQYLHTLIEALRIAFADARWYVCDPSVEHVPIQELLSKAYTAQRRKLLRPDQATPDLEHGSPVSSSDTVYFSVVDGDGNACSFINSNYMGFGTGLVPEGCGFTLQNRGANFTLEAGHRNVLAPKKRPYHTIIPAMATKDGELLACFGVMGGFMQPQGHVQVLLNMLEFGMDPQAALDAPRFCIGPGHAGSQGDVGMEEGVEEDVVAKLREMGHAIRHPVVGYERSLFGRGQIIRQLNRDGERVLVAGTDRRADGVAIGY